MGVAIRLMVPSGWRSVEMFEVTEPYPKYQLRPWIGAPRGAALPASDQGRHLLTAIKSGPRLPSNRCPEPRSPLTPTMVAGPRLVATLLAAIFLLSGLASPALGAIEGPVTLSGTRPQHRAVPTGVRHRWQHQNAGSDQLDHRTQPLPRWGAGGVLGGNRVMARSGCMPSTWSGQTELGSPNSRRGAMASSIRGRPMGLRSCTASTLPGL